MWMGHSTSAQAGVKVRWCHKKIPYNLIQPYLTQEKPPTSYFIGTPDYATLYAHLLEDAVRLLDREYLEQLRKLSLAEAGPVPGLLLRNKSSVAIMGIYIYIYVYVYIYIYIVSDMVPPL